MTSLPPGTTISVKFGFYKHYGLVSEKNINGVPMIISNSFRRKGVYAEPWEDLTCNRKIEIRGFPGQLDPHLVLSRARSKIGTKWNLINWNCEHFVNWAHGLKAHSPQLNAYATCASIVLGIVILHKMAKINRH